MDSYLRPCVVRVGEEPRARLAVDTWRQPGCGAYFCTHAHADHTVGLSDCWSDGPLFCSEATRTLLLLKWPRLARLVTALQFDETTVLHLGDALVSVLTLWAGHCPGSAAFLFQGEVCGRVFHSGDWRREELSSLPVALTCAPVDVVYLDNTFCHPSYTHPPRAVALALLLAALAEHLTGEHAASKVLLAVDTLGKEELLEACAAASGRLVYCDHKRLVQTRALNLPTQHLTTCWHEAAVAAVPRWRVSHKALNERPVQPPAAADNAEDAQLPRERFHLALAPTGWPPQAGRPEEEAQGAAGHATRIVAVPYSLHASFGELEALVRALRPRRLVGLVASPRYAERPVDPNLHFQHLLSPSDGGAPAPAAAPAAAPTAAPAKQAPPPAPAPRAPGQHPSLLLSADAMLARMRLMASSLAFSAAAPAARRRGGGGVRMALSVAAPGPNVREDVREHAHPVKRAAEEPVVDTEESRRAKR